MKIIKGRIDIKLHPANGYKILKLPYLKLIFYVVFHNKSALHGFTYLQEIQSKLFERRLFLVSGGWQCSYAMIS